MRKRPVRWLDSMRTAARMGRFVLTHPMNRDDPLAAVARLLRWQLGSRLLGYPAVMDWVDGSRLIVQRGMTGVTGNLYTGLHEYADMAFVLHYLRPGDTFLDIGANVGSYTVLAAAVCRARVVAFEPVPATYQHLLDHVHLNVCSDRVDARNVALGATPGSALFTQDRGSGNHAVACGETVDKGVEVPVVALDSAVGPTPIDLIKVDVEGFEGMVVDGGTRAFARVPAVIMELNGSGARYGCRDADVASKMKEFGFSPYAYDPAERVLRTVDVLQPGIGNVIFVRQMQPVAERVTTAKARLLWGRPV